LGVEFYADRHTERYDEANNPFAKAPKKLNALYLFNLKPYCIVMSLLISDVPYHLGTANLFELL